jgi:hypothetical protein
MSEAGKVVDAEKGRNLSPQNLHIRLRVVEAVVLLSLVLNLVQGYVAMRTNEKTQAVIDRLDQQQAPR